MVIVTNWPSASTSTRVFSSRSRLSATVPSLKVICSVSVSAKYSTLTVVLLESPIEERVVNSLSVFQENDSEIPAFGFVDSAPQANPTIRLDVFAKRVPDHAFDPFRVNLPDRKSVV